MKPVGWMAVDGPDHATDGYGSPVHGEASALLTKQEQSKRTTGPRHSAPGRPLLTPRNVSWAVAIVGLLLRLREYAANPSIWNDEAELALNIINRSYGGLTHTLASDQGAPIGFLFLEKTAVELFGPRGFALRLVPFVAALILVLVFRSLSMRTLGGWAGCVATTIVAVSPTLVFYASDAKQYSGDATAVVVLAWMTIRSIERRHSLSTLIVWGVSAALLVWVSFPAAFAAGCGTLVLLATARREKAEYLRVIAVSLLWVVSFGIEYFVSLRSLHANGTLINFWSYGLAPSQGSKTVWAYQVVDGVMHSPLELIVLPVAAILMGVGAVSLVWLRRPIGLFCVIMLVVTLFAGLVREYPVADRLVLYLVPIAALLLAGTLLLPRRFALVSVVLVALVTATNFGSASVALIHPYAQTSGRQALQFALARAGRHDAVLIEGSVSNLYTFYHQAAGMTITGSVTLLSPTQGTSCSPTQQSTWLQKYGRVWIVWAPPTAYYPPSGLNQFRSALGAAGQTTIAARFPDDTAVLVTDPHRDRDGATSLAAPSWLSGKSACLSFYIYPT